MAPAPVALPVSSLDPAQVGKAGPQLNAQLVTQLRVVRRRQTQVLGRADLGGSLEKVPEHIRPYQHRLPRPEINSLLASLNDRPHAMHRSLSSHPPIVPGLLGV
jgi:hypothetical protein